MLKISTITGFEPVRVKHNRFLVDHLGHSVKSSHIYIYL